MGERVVVIRNPAAGNGRSPFIEVVAERLRRGGQDVTIADTNAPGHATEIAEKLARTGEAQVIIAAGGDGTIRDVAEGAFGHDVALGIIPAGTANVLARELGYMPHGRIGARHVSDVLLSRSLKDLYPFDVYFDGRSRMGICWLGAGFDARVLEHVSPTLKAKIGRASFVPATIKALWHEKKVAPIEWLTSDGGKGSCYWFIAANIRRYAGPFVLTRQTEVSEPGLACLMLERQGAWARMVEQVSLALGRLDKKVAARALGNGNIEVADENIPLQLDGDFLGYGGAVITPRLVPIAFRAHI
ncbi:diacylglycerol/lipid kinase family protein [Kordiimonas sp.]|uniref:diacylglycerol/lipid kinase family protein n=1 Tax=Kordiimonas sp. TaxID=1970157 RepID=UPI003A9186AD